MTEGEQEVSDRADSVRNKSVGKRDVHDPCKMNKKDVK